MAQWVHGDDLLLVGPGREGTEADGRFGVGEVGFVVDVEIFGGDG